MQLQMVDQSIQFLEGIAKDVMVRIHDQFGPGDLMVLDMVKKKMIHPSSCEVHFQIPREKVCCYFNSYTTYE